MFRYISDRAEYNRIGPSQGHKTFFFFWGVAFGPGQGKIWGITGSGAKNLVPQDSNFKLDSRYSNLNDLLLFIDHTLSSQEIFGSEITLLNRRSGILCAEHAGKSHEIYADGVCLTILIFTTTDKNPKDRNEFIWHRIRNTSIIEDLEKRLQTPETSIPLFYRN